MLDNVGRSFFLSVSDELFQVLAHAKVENIDS